MPDPYQILNISTTATPEEIRKAFRKLAMAYHPDKNAAPLAAQKFAGIQEAYAILKDPVKKAACDYRRYQSAPAQSQRPEPASVDEVMIAAARLFEKAPSIDPFRLNIDQLGHELGYVLSDHTIALLQANGDVRQWRQMLHYLHPLIRHLPLPLALEVLNPLSAFARQDNLFARQLAEMIRELRHAYYWNKYKIWAALSIAILVCFLLYFAGR
jgi:curved DNA-binding protein CbpA